MQFLQHGILMSLILNYKVEKNHSKHLFNFDNIEALARGEAPDGITLSVVVQE